MKGNEGLTRSFQAPATIRKFPNSHVYLFKGGQSDSDDSEEELDVMELRARRKEQRSRASQEKVGDVVLLEREVLEDDSVNKLALQYGCKVQRHCSLSQNQMLDTIIRKGLRSSSIFVNFERHQVADIKRINNFMQEQDLYALKSIKIPVKVNGILTESSEGCQVAPQGTGPLATARSELEDRGGGGGGGGGSSNCVDDKQISIDQYLRGIDRNIEAATRGGVSLSTDYRIETPNWSPLGWKDNRSGVDCGIQWWNAVCVMLLVGIVLPVFYIVYFKSQESELAPTTSNTTLPGNSTLLGAWETAPVRTLAKESAGTVRTPKIGTSVPSGG